MSSYVKEIDSWEDIEEVNIFNIRINPLRRSEFLAIIESAIRNRRQLAQFGVNSATINDIVRNDEFRNTINSADLVHIDGMSVVWALRSFGYAVPERVATPDLADDILAMANQGRMSIFLFGAQENILSLCRKNIEKKFPNIVIAGCRNGYYKPEEEKDIFDLINKAKPDILFLGMSSPKKELFFESYKHRLEAKYILGVGGYFDIMSGQIRRAPRWMQDTGLEWLFRLMQEPRRLWKRYLIGIFQFFWLVTKEKIRRAFKRKGE
ncbi:MAG: WecB/TagA/CpsF family glycosyltransferase [Prolixibacteraceae bacterium]|jgi:N-acetylglucosaminyldiphosphoundecaprenol N-acetyl-beta-D-mannosaminyltransferase|nr:WecB/TagA/CpsF family glycosyltransferase [Prolixibacteraceae bacterium]OQC18449.1 MAG: putative N-acetylmannosaminyltransferase [Firmicutes bacterium ADurb.Bin080]